MARRAIDVCYWECAIIANLPMYMALVCHYSNDKEPIELQCGRWLRHRLIHCFLQSLDARNRSSIFSCNQRKAG